MANLYAKLRRQFAEDKVDIVYTEPLSYMNAVLPKNGIVMASQPHQKIIIVCKKENVPLKQLKITPKKISNENSSVDLNLTGSPLRDDCEIDEINDSMDSFLGWNNLWTEEDETYRSISITRSQQILSEICMDADARDKMAFWALGDRNDDNTLLTFVELTSDWNKRGVVKFMGQCAYEEMDLMRLEKKHLSHIAKPNNIMETTIDSYYQLNIEEKNNMKLQLSRTISGPISSKALKDFERDSKMILHQSVRIDNHDSVIETFWRQIRILELIKESIVAFKDTDDFNRLVFTVGTEELANVKQDIFTSFTEVTSVYVQSDENEKDSLIEIEAIVNKAKFRDNVELTDQLWSVLKGCSSFSDLKSAVEFALTCAVKYNVVNLPTNDNRLANWVRDLAEKRMAIPQLHGSEPLELLLEIGIEKVAKDYEYIFSESRICSADSLKFKETVADVAADNASDVSRYNIRKSLKTPMHRPSNEEKVTASQNMQRKTLIHSKSESYNRQEHRISGNGFQNSYFNLHDVENKLAHLAQIHLVLEHMLMIRSTLNLENVYTSFLDDIKKPAKPFHFLVEQKYDSREIVVMNPKILSKIDGQFPDQKRITMFSSNKLKQVQSTFFFSVDAIFPPEVFECIPSTSGVTKASKYYGHHTLALATRFR